MERISTSWDKAANRAREIEQKNFELGGLLSIYAKLPPQEQKSLMDAVLKLRTELSGTDPKLYLERVRALGEMYGAVSRNLKEEDTPNLSQTLTWRLGEMESAMKAVSINKEKRAA